MSQTHSTTSTWVTLVKIHSHLNTGQEKIAAGDFETFVCFSILEAFNRAEMRNQLAGWRVLQVSTNIPGQSKFVCSVPCTDHILLHWGEQLCIKVGTFWLGNFFYLNLNFYTILATLSVCAVHVNWNKVEKLCKNSNFISKIDKSKCQLPCCSKEWLMLLCCNVHVHGHDTDEKHSIEGECFTALCHALLHP